MALATTILEGNRRKITATFKTPNESGSLADPSTVTFHVRNLDTDAYTALVYNTDPVARESQGVYSFEFDFNDDGTWVVGAEGTGVCMAYDEISIVVENGKAKP